MPHLIALNNLGEDYSLRKPKLWGPKVYVIPRSDCSFRRFQMRGKGRPAISAAQISAKQEAPTDNNEVLIVKDKTGNGAGLWFFTPKPGFERAYIPESLVFSPLEEGVRVVAGLKGFEGQVWAGSNLTSSRWWANQPSEREWDLFLRASKIDIKPEHRALITPQSVPINPNSSYWGASKDYFVNLLSPKRLSWIGGLSVAMVSLYLGAHYLRATHILRETKTEIASKSEAAQLVLSQRRRALKNAQAIQEIRSFGDEALPLSVLYGLTSVLSQSELIITSLSISGNDLTITMVGDTELNGPETVTLLEGIPSLMDATVAFDSRNKITVRAELVPFKIEDTLKVTKERAAQGHENKIRKP